jgi:Protein of unknown function (DUF1566)
VEKLARTVNHDQSPAIYNQARGSFYFFAPSVVINQPAPTAPPPPPTNTGFSAQQLEERFWDGTVIVGNDAAFQAYLKAYPQGRYADLAKAKLSPVATQGATPSSTPPLASGSPVRAQARSENAPISAPTNDAKTVEPGWSRINGRYLGKGDEVFDEKTRLVWKRCAEGMTWSGVACEGTALGLGLNTALAKSQEVAKAEGLSWRLPEQDELMSLVDRSASSPKINLLAFPATPAFFFWTATQAWPSSLVNVASAALNFENGYAGQMSPSSAMHVGLVRTYVGNVSPVAQSESRAPSSPEVQAGISLRPQAKSEALGGSLDWVRINGRFLVKGDEVLDERMKLIWKRCAEGMKWSGLACEGTALRFSWSAGSVRALGVSREESLSWRLPERDELLSLVDQAASAVKIDSLVFPGTPLSFFWTANQSSPNVYNPSSTAINFENGYDAYMPNTSAMNVRLVRLIDSKRPSSVTAQVEQTTRPETREDHLPKPPPMVDDVGGHPVWLRINGRFLVKGDEVRDQNTKLIWKRCPEGMRWTGEACEGTGQRYGWSRAVTRAQEISKAEGLPCSLPEAEDLKALVEHSASPAKIDAKAFPGTPAYYFWLANPLPSAVIKSATAVNFEDGIGSSLSESSPMHLRFVRRQ